MRVLVVTLSAAIGLLVGVRATMAVTVSGAEVFFLDALLLPVESLGIEWSRLAVFPADLQRAGVERLLRTVGVMVGGAVLVSTLNVATALAESAGARGRDFAIRSAHGASTAALVRALLLELRVLILGALCLGVPGGLGLGLAIRSAWPGTTASPLQVAPVDLVAGLVVVLTAVTLAHVFSALRPTREDRLATALRSGSRTGWDPAAIFVRRTLSALHVAVGGTVLVTAWALARTAPAIPATAVPGVESEPERAAFVLPVSADEPEAWASALRTLRAETSVAAESLSTPGALLGLGVRDMTITECGACSIGMMPAPLWNASAEIHAVSHGFHELVGIEVLEGRGFAPTDDADAPLAALVSRRLADVAFEDGLAVGKRLRVGDDLETWYTVVGIVEDRVVQVPGEDDAKRGSVYLSALQRPPRSARLLLHVAPDDLAASVDLVESAGVEVGEPLTLDGYLAGAGAPVRWAALMVRLTGLLVLVLGAHGVYLTALQTTRRRARDMALRSALGAPAISIARVVVTERLRTTGWGLAGFAFLGTFVSAGLQKASAAPAIGPEGYLVLGAGAVAIVLAASVRAVREALAVEPGELLD